MNLRAPGTVVLVHGAWGGAWMWWKVAPLLDERGIAHVAVDLPTCGARDTSVDMRDDAAHVRSVVDAIDGPVVLAGNSYGGVVISHPAVVAPNVARLVYIAGQMPDAGEPVMEMLAACATDALRDAVAIRPDGRMSIDVEVSIAEAYCQASPADHDVIRRKISGAMSYGTDFGITFEDVSWRHVPTTYVVCADDRATQPEFERRWAKERATEALEWPTDHCPHVSDPVRVADLLAKVATTGA